MAREPQDIAAAELSEEENDRLWAEEAERRYAAYKAGPIEAVPAEEVFARLRSRM
jgi:putative addiction module component (TIGR02574 family)